MMRGAAAPDSDISILAGCHMAERFGDVAAQGGGQFLGEPLGGVEVGLGGLGAGVAEELLDGDDRVSEQLVRVGAAFAAIGCFASALTDKQVLAAAVAFFAASCLWLVEWLARNTTGWLKMALTHFSMRAHLLDFFNGILVTSHVLFYTFFALFWLFLAVQVTEGLRWR